MPRQESFPIFVSSSLLVNRSDVQRIVTIKEVVESQAIELQPVKFVHKKCEIFVKIFASFMDRNKILDFRPIFTIICLRWVRGGLIFTIFII